MSARVNRRDLIGLAGAALPVAARGQQNDRIRRVGMMEGVDDEEGRARLDAFHTTLRQLGWTEGQNIRFEYRWPAGNAQRIHQYAAELVKLQPDVIVVEGVPAAAALLQETRTIPIVMAQGSDPVAAGFVTNLARPGRNFTGFVNYEYGMAGKWLEILKEIAPQVVRAAIIHNPDNPTWPGQLQAIEAIAAEMKLTMAGVHDAAEILRLVDEFAREPNGGLIVMPVIVNNANRDLIIALAAKYRMPAVFPIRHFTSAGGLVSYGIITTHLYRGAGVYVDRILRGEKPGDLAIQLPTKFELVVNLKAAKAIGLSMPVQFLLRADEIIE